MQLSPPDLPALALTAAASLSGPAPPAPLTPRQHHSSQQHQHQQQASVYVMPPQAQQQQANGHAIPVFKAVIETGEEEFVRGTRGLDLVPQEDRADVKSLWHLLRALHHSQDRAHDEPTELAVVAREDAEATRIEYYEIYAYGYLDEITLEDMQRVRQSNPRAMRLAVQPHAVGANPEHSRGALVVRLQSRCEDRSRKRRLQENALLQAGLLGADADASLPPRADDDAASMPPPAWKSSKKRNVLGWLFGRGGGGENVAAQQPA